MANKVNVGEEKALSKNGLLYFWQKLKVLFEGKVDKVDGKGLSTNDYTTAEKEKLAGIATGANKTTVEDVLTSTSASNALSANQGRVLNEKIKDLADSMGELGYGDMMKATYDADNDGKVDQALHADNADLAANATKAADADKFGGQAPAYYAKAADIPTSTSQLTNDSGYITQAAVPTKVGALENDAGYITQAAVPTKVSAFENDANYLTEHQDITNKLDKTGDGSNVTATFTQAGERTNIATGEKLTTIFGKISKYLADLKLVAFTGKYSDLSGLPTIPTVTNDLTDELKGNYDAAYAHSQEAHAPADAEKNVVVGVQVNGADLAVDSVTRKVNVQVPTTVAQLSDASEYAKKTDLANVYEYKGSVANAEALPAGAEVGDVYNLEDTGMNVAWNGSAWDDLGSIFTINYITNAEIDEIMAQ